MKKLVLIALAALFLSITYAQPTAPIINIGSIDGSAPYSYVNGEGNPEGYAVDVVKHIMKRLNIPYQFTIHTEPQAQIKDLSQLNERILSKSDLSIVAILAPAHRRLHYHSLPYSKIYYYIISRKSLPYSGVKDFAGKNVVARKLSISEKQIESLPPGYINKFISCIDIPSGIKLISSGKADYLLLDDFTLRRYRNFILDQDLEISPSNLEPLSVSMASDNGELIRRINHTIEQMEEDGTLRQLYEKWLIYDEGLYKKSYTNTLLLILLITVSIATLLVIIFRKKAKRAKHNAVEVSMHNEELVYAINLLLKNGNTDIFMYNTTTQRLYTLKDGIFVLSNTGINAIESNIHPDDLEQYSTDYANIVSGKNDYIVTTLRVFHAAANDYRYFEFTIMPASKDLNGIITSYYYSRRDTTHVQQELKLKERVIGGFKLAMLSAHLIRWRFNVKKYIITLHYSDNRDVKISPDTLLSNVSDSDVDKFRNYLFGESHGNEKEDIFIKIRLDGHTEYRTCKISSRIQRDKNGHPENIFGVINDMTSEVESRIELEKNFNKIPTPVYIVDPELNQVVYRNEQAYLEFGLEVGVVSTDVYQKKQGEECAKRNQDVYETGIDYTANETLIFRNGDIKYTLVKKTLVNYNGKGHILISRVDLTEQERMSQVKKLLSTSLPAFNAFTWSIDGRNHTVTYNESGRTGVSNVQQVGSIEQCLTILHPDDRANYKNTLLDYIAKGEGEFTIIYRSRTSPQDSYEWWETRGIAETVHSDATRYTVLYGITINITHQKLNELSLKESQNKLIEINKQNELILNNSSSGIAYVNSAFEVMWSNVKYADHLNLPSGTFEVGSKCFEMFGRCDVCDHCPMRDADKNQLSEVCTREVNLGANGIYYIQTTPVLDDNGIEGMVIRVDNITERAVMIQNLEREKERAEKLYIEQTSYIQLLSTVIEKFPGILFIKNVHDDFKYMFVSAEFCSKVARLPREQIIGYSDFEIFKDTEIIRQLRKDDLHVVAHSQGRTVEIGEETLEINGIKHIFHTTKLSVKLSNGQELLIGSAVDITHLKKINEDLIIARQKAEESEQLKMAFLANMSHEIRTPLNAIVGFSELLQETTDEVEKEEFIGIINKNNELLLRLIGDILDLSKIESGSIDLKNENFDFVSTIQEIYDTWQQRNHNPHLKLILESPYKSCRVYLDKSRIMQVGINFITNALKHTQCGSITIGYTYQDNGIKLYVTDTGIGIPEDKQNKIFERFAKLDNFSQGTGLGLAICKAIAESCGGTIGFESQQNVGSTFWAWFPCNASIV